MKICSTCKIEKDESLFEKRKDSKDSLRGQCKACGSARDRATRLRDINKRLVKEQEYRDKEGNKQKRLLHRNNNKDKISKYGKQRYQDNKERIKQNAKDYYLKNREAKIQYQLDYQRNNKDKFTAIQNKHRAARLMATPKWAEDEFEKFVIEEMYSLSRLRTKLTGVKHHVDHIAPLVSKLVCGLHCVANLRIVEAHINSKKGNVYWPDMP